jgi:CCR4-NOT transcription complex subunit 9
MSNDIETYVHQLINQATRENALLELSKKRENFPELAPYLWYSFGTISALLQEIVSIYPLLSPPSLTAHASNRVCNALALLQCVASHPETRGLFLQGEWGMSGCSGHTQDLAQRSSTSSSRTACSCRVNAA